MNEIEERITQELKGQNEIDIVEPKAPILPLKRRRTALLERCFSMDTQVVTSACFKRFHDYPTGLARAHSTSHSVISDLKPSVTFRHDAFWTRKTESSHFFAIEESISAFLEAEDIVPCCPDDFKTHLKSVDSNHKSRTLSIEGSSLFLKRRLLKPE